MTEAKTAMAPSREGIPRTAENHQKARRKDSPLEPSGGLRPADSSTVDAQLPTLGDNKSVVLRHQVYGTLLQQPWETNTVRNPETLAFITVSLELRQAGKSRSGLTNASRQQVQLQQAEQVRNYSEPSLPTLHGVKGRVVFSLGSNPLIPTSTPPLKSHQFDF